MSLSDNPVTKTENDRLNRAPMAKHVARFVNDFEAKDSFVVGIEGEWGSGKSSFINFVCQEVDPTKAEIIFFNPWNFSSQDQLIEDFFNALLEAIEKIDSHSKLIDGLKKYKRKLKNVEINPSFMGVSVGSWRPETSLGALRKALEVGLSKLEKKITIIIDDIDRLDTAETLAIFKLVKVTANFPNCIFFLAYDRKRVVQRIDKETNNSGDDYLKKIIQTTFRLPSISREGIKEMVFEQIDSVLEKLFGEIKLNDEDTKRWSSIVYSGFPELFQNIRDLKRYASSLELNLAVIGKYEVNIIDFVALEAIRVFAPDFYDAIPNNSWLFIQTSHGLSYYTRNEDKRPVAYQHIVDTTLNNHPAKDKILKIIEELFPQVAFNTNYSSDFQETWSGNKQVCADSKFQTYFQLVAPSNEISEEEFEQMMDLISSKTVGEISSVLPLFEKLDSENKLRNFLKKTHNRFDRDYGNKPSFFHNIAVGLFISIHKLDTKKDVFFDFEGVERQMYRLVWRISEKIDGEEDKYLLLNNLISLNSGLYYKVDLLRVFQKEKTGQEAHLRDVAVAISRSVADLLPLLQKAIDEDTLKSEPNGNHIIWGYTDWGKEQEIKGYLTKLASNADDVFVIIKWFRSEVDSSTRGRYFRINKEAIGKFVSLEIVDNTISGINVDSLSDENKELYNLYKTADEDNW